MIEHNSGAPMSAKVCAALLDVWSPLVAVVASAALLVIPHAGFRIGAAVGVGVVVVAVVINSGIRQGRTGASAGKELTGLMVVADNSGRPIGVRQMLVRLGRHGADVVTGYGWLRGARSSGRTFADSVSGTRVVSSERSPALRKRLRSRRFVWCYTATLLVVALTATAMLGVFGFRPVERERANEAEVSAFAVTAVQAVLSYRSETVSDDTKAAKALLTGDFAEYYDQFTTEVVIPAANDKHVSMVAKVVAASVVDVSPADARVLVFVNQTATTGVEGAPTTTQTAVDLSLKRRDGNWRITDFEPII